MEQIIKNLKQLYFSASKDATFDPRISLDPKFDHFDVFVRRLQIISFFIKTFFIQKGITGLTNGYKQFIEAQINPFCKKQGENSNFVSNFNHFIKHQGAFKFFHDVLRKFNNIFFQLNRIKLWAGIWKFKYCALVNPSYAGCADTKHHSNPKDDGRNPFTQDQFQSRIRKD